MPYKPDTCFWCQILLPRRLLPRLDEVAKRNGKAINIVIEEVVCEWLDREDPQPAGPEDEK